MKQHAFPPIKRQTLLRRLAGAAALLFMVPLLGLSSGAADGAGNPTAEKPTSLSRGEALAGKAYVEAAANSRLTLLCNPSDGSLLVEDRQTGRVYRSNPENPREDPLAKGVTRTNMSSQLLITAADAKGTVESYNSSVDCVGEGGLTVSRTTDGVILDYRFEKLGIAVPLAVTLSENGLRVQLLFGEVQEENADYRLMDVSLLPYFGAAGPEEQGYMLLPDGSGALLRFNNGKTAFGVYSKPVYSNDDYESERFRTRRGEPIMLPVFGMHYEAAEEPAGDRKEAGFLAAAYSGAALATLNAVPGGVNCSYNNAWFSFTYRASRSTSILSRTWAEKSFNMISRSTASDVDPVVEYSFLASESTGYTAMARQLGETLRTLGMEPLESARPKLVLDVYNSVRKLGYTLGIPHEKSAVVTSFEETAAILKDFENTPVALRLLGWDKDGAAGGSVRYRYRPASSAGGKQGLEALLSYAGEHGVELYLEAEAARFTDGTLRFNSMFHTASQITNKPIQVYSYRRSTNEQNTALPVGSLLAPHLLPDVLDRLESALPDSVSGLSLGSVSQYPYADYGKEYSSPENTAQVMAGLLEQASETRGLYAENPAWYALPYLRVAADIPLASSEYDFFDESVPFVQLALRGLVTLSTPSLNLSGSPEKVFLKAVETGSSLKFSFIGSSYDVVRDTQLNTLYGARYELWKDSAAAWQARLEEALHGLESAAVLEHRMLTETVAAVVYDNGEEILVNYGEKPFTAGGDTVEPLSYLRRPAGGNGE